MKSYWKWIFYSAYTIGALILFLILLFPETEVKEYLIYRAQKHAPGVSLEIGRVSPTIPPGLNLQQIDVTLEDGGRIQLESVGVRPALLTILSSRKAYSIKGSSFGGTFSGRVTTGADTPAVTAEFTLDALLTEQIGILNQLIAFPVNGPLSGEIRYQQEAASGPSGEADLEISPLAVRADLPFLNLKELTFSQVNAKFSLQKDLRVDILEIVAKGNQFSGNASGWIRIGTPIENSILNIAGTVKPHPTFMAQMGSAAAGLLTRGRAQNGGIPVALRGTLDNPKVSIQ